MVESTGLCWEVLHRGGSRKYKSCSRAMMRRTMPPEESYAVAFKGNACSKETHGLK